MTNEENPRDGHHEERTQFSQTGRSGAPDRTRLTTRLLSAILVIIGFAAIKAMHSVLVPVVFAVFMIALVWPIQERLQAKVRPGVATLCSVLVILAAAAVFFAVVWLAFDEVAEARRGGLSAGLQGAVEELRRTAAAWGLPGFDGESSGLPKPIEQGLVVGGGFVVSFVSGFVLAIAFFALGLHEVASMGHKLERVIGERNGPTWIQSAKSIARDFQRYLLVRTVIGLITGTAVALFSFVVGLELALVWGLINFILNYIPTLGSILGVIPPALYALAQFDGATMPLVVLVGVAFIQLLMGNYIDPLMQGRYLSLSPLVVLLAVTFGGWLWGVAGAFIGVPLVIGVTIVCDHFERSRWLAILLSHRSDEDQLP